MFPKSLRSIRSAERRFSCSRAHLTHRHVLIPHLKRSVEARSSRTQKRKPAGIPVTVTKCHSGHLYQTPSLPPPVLESMCFYPPLTTWIHFMPGKSLKLQHNKICSLAFSLLQHFPLPQMRVYRRREGKKIYSQDLTSGKKFRLCVMIGKLFFS